MAKMVVAAFGARADADRAIERLIDEGFDRADVDLHAGDWAESKTQESGSWWDWLFGQSDERTTYQEHSRAGAIVSVTTVSEGAANRARRLLDETADDVQITDDVELGDDQVEQPVRATAAAVRETTPSSTAGRTGGDEKVVPVVEERLKVGKRPVVRGNVRVYARVLEEPVEEQIRLREERIRVERRPVDRPATAADVRGFREDVVEMTETSEEAVVEKVARVTEEIAVGKDVGERTETVRDTVRRTDVRVDEGERTPNDAAAYGRYESDFRTHAATIGGGRPYEEYRDAYRAGCELAVDPRYAGRDWSAIESDVRSDWDGRRPGTWERFKDALRYAWERARGTRRAA